MYKKFNKLINNFNWYKSIVKGTQDNFIALQVIYSTLTDQSFNKWLTNQLINFRYIIIFIIIM